MIFKKTLLLAIAGLIAFIFGVKPAWVKAEDYRIDFSNPIALPQKGGYNYAYAPSLIKDNGSYYAFFCSRPINIDEADGWDVVRLVKSTDLKTWSQPKVVLFSRQTKNSVGKYENLAACDPSLTYKDGYYYLYYSNALEIDLATSLFSSYISVARSQDIEGPYLTLAEDNTWQNNPQFPKKIVKAKNITTLDAPYGAGQQSVVWRDNKAYMWYMDDTAYRSIPGLFMATSDDGINFISKETNLSNVRGHSPDIKYDEVNKQFVMMQIQNSHTSNSALGYRTSQDGVNWSEIRMIEAENNFPDFAHNVGLLSDREGKIYGISDIYAGFGAPYELSASDNWGYWQLQGMHLIDTSFACTGSFGVCSCIGGACKNEAGSNTDFRCCHRECVNNACSTVAGSGDNKCDGEGSKCGTVYSPADVNHDNFIDLNDFVYWKQKYVLNQLAISDFLKWKDVYVAKGGLRKSQFGMGNYLFNYYVWATGAGGKTPQDALQNVEKQYGVFKGMGLKLAREDLPWRALETNKGQWNWAASDYVMNLYQTEDNLSVILGTSPAWASSAPSSVSIPAEREKYPAQNLTDWLGYVDAVVTRYKNKVKNWEIWNEADVDSAFFVPEPGKTKEQSYADLLIATYREIKKIDPEAKVVVNAFGAWQIAEPGEPALIGNSMLSEIKKRNVGIPFDVMNIHTYSIIPPGEEVARTHRYLQSLGWGEIPVWVTETNIDQYFKRSANIPAGGNSVGNVVNNFDWWIDDQLKSGAEKVFWFTILNFPCDPQSSCFQMWGAAGLADFGENALAAKIKNWIIEE